MEKFNNIKLQMEIINYTTDRVYYFEDLHEGIDTLENLQDKNPGYEIGVSYFSICGVDVPYSEENIEFIEENDEDTIWEVIKYYEYIYGTHRDADLNDVKDDMENRCVTIHYGDSEEDAFEEYAEELGLLNEVPDEFRYYIDFEKMCRDYTLSGLTIIELPYEGMERKYMFVS